MNLTDVFKKKRVFSVEVFPPKRDGDLNRIYDTIAALKQVNPDFISVTYGAGGSDGCRTGIEIVQAIQDRWGITGVAHLPAFGLSRADVDAVLERYRKANISNILALRGDRPAGKETLPPGDFPHASDLVAYIKTHGDFDICGACYPEVHPEAPSAVADIRNLKKKVDAGASHLITQLFFENEHFYRFREKCELAGISVPIEAGIMPVINSRQIQRMASLCGAFLPKKFLKIMHRYENKPEALRDAGIAYAVDQIVDLVTNGVDGIHLYTMNRAYTAEKIYEAVHNLINIDD